MMIFLDLDNFRQSLFRRDKSRFFDFGKFQYFLINLLKNDFNFVNCLDESLIRTYAYTGEFTSSLLKKIRNEEDVEKYKMRMNAQQRFFDKLNGFNYFELKTLPLKYENGRFFQKGIDVQMAVDLIYHAFNDNFDLVVICSGDIDLKEAVKLVKNLGKKVIIMSHKRLASKEIVKEADLFINIDELTEEQLNKFSRIK
jgi:uncharacterized LabA/DUF88 family protein